MKSCKKCGEAIKQPFEYCYNHRHFAYPRCMCAITYTPDKLFVRKYSGCSLCKYKELNGKCLACYKPIPSHFKYCYKHKDRYKN